MSPDYRDFLPIEEDDIHFSEEEWREEVAFAKAEAAEYQFDRYLSCW